MQVNKLKYIKNKINNTKFYSLVFCILISLFFINIPQSQAVSLDRVSGRILLQVEANGEAWYVKPEDNKRVFLFRPEDAFEAMRSLGLGISNSNLEKIPAAHENFDDNFDLSLSKKLAGKILLQVEENGEAYYINPENYKKHYLGRPSDAFQIMRELGLGITNADLLDIEVDTNFNTEDVLNVAKEIDINVDLSDTSIKIDYSDASFTEDVELIINKETKVKNLPWNLQVLSPVYNYKFESNGLHDPAHIFVVKIYYPEDNYNLKHLFSFDSYSQSFKEIDVKENIEENYIYYETNSITGNVILMEEAEVMNRGKASWYKYKNGLFAASPDYPKGSVLRVTNLDNNKTVDVVINDYGPDRSIHPDRVIDLDYVAFSEIASPSSGIIDVKVEVIKLEEDKVEISSYKSFPEITANSAVVMNIDNNEIIYAKNYDQVVPIASLSKLVFAEVFLSLNIDFDKQVSYNIADEEYNLLYCQPKGDIKMLKLEDGDTLTINDLFYSAIMYSANNAVETLVRNSGLSRDEFISRMNKFASGLGAENTRFIEPTGLSPKNVSSAKDYAIISKEVFDNNFLNKISSSSYYSFKTINSEKEFKLYNTNKSLNKNTYNIDASKTGYLHESGYCLTTKVSQGVNSLIVINLNSDSSSDREQENEDLAKYAFTIINR